jgi:P pilus assembly chaperone PapD
MMVCLAGIMVISFFFNVEATAQGNLLITPRRVVFEESKKSMDLNLANIGNDTATYTISIVQIRMKEDGGFETITQPDPDQLFADKYIRFFPRSVTLGPNESQVIKVQLTKTSELTPGEYRSHFYFRAVPKPKPLGENEEKIDTSTISIQLTPVFGITIPIIIRIGASTTKVTISDLNLKTVNDTVPNFSLIFNRSGNMSCFGDLTVDHVSPQGKITRVGIANGIAVYTPNPRRRFQFNLRNVPEVDYKTGSLKVTYSATSDVKPVKYAEAELTLH